MKLLFSKYRNLLFFGFTIITLPDINAQVVFKNNQIDTSEYISGDLDFNLMVAADKGYDKEVLRLLNTGAKVNSKNFDGVTPLMFAVQNNHLKTARILLLNDADPDITGKDITPPLIVAANNGYFEMTELLLQHLANPDIKDDAGATPLMYAAANGDIQIADMLLYYLGSINKADKFGTTSLHVAAFYGIGPMLEYFIRMGAAVDTADQQGFTPLHSAIQNNHIEVADSLLNNGGKINSKTRSGFTPLSIAILNNNKRACEFLLESGADINQLIKTSYYPMDLANDYANDTVKDLLNSYNAPFGRMPLMDNILLGLDLNISTNDVMSGIRIGISDSRYNFSLEGGFSTRLHKMRVLVEKNEYLYYQYWEHRSLVHFGLTKRFRLIERSRESDFGILAGAKYAITFGKYRATEEKPPVKHLFVPFAGLYYQYKIFTFSLNFEYMDMNVYRISPGRLNFGMSFHIPTKRKVKPERKELWYY